MASKSARRDSIPAALLFAQGALTVAWWPWIRASTHAQDLFFADGAADIVLSKFAAPDIIVFAGSSVLASLLAFTGSRGARRASWFVVGAAAYACVGALAVNWPLFSVPLADALMICTLLCSVFCAVRLGRSARG